MTPVEKESYSSPSLSKVDVALFPPKVQGSGFPNRTFKGNSNCWAKEGTVASEFSLIDTVASLAYIYRLPCSGKSFCHAWVATSQRWKE